MDWLLTFPGAGWRDRWVAGSGDTDSLSWLEERRQRDRRCSKTVRVIAVEGMRTLIVSRVILPGYAFFSNWKTKGYKQIVDQQDPQLLARMNTFANKNESSERELADAWRVLGRIMLHTGKDLPALGAEDIFELRAHCQKYDEIAPVLGLVWKLLASVEILPEGSTLRTALRVGRRTAAELVDRYGISPGPVRDLLVRYLDERKTSVDYTTLKSNARMLVGNFWADLECHHPELSGANSLALPKEIVSAWKERLSVVTASDGSTRPRSDFLDVLLTVRAFYLDLRDWALDEPSLVGWVVGSPITSADVAGTAKRKLANQARIHQRIRERVPLVPRMLVHLEQERRTAEQLLHLARQTPIDAQFTFDNRTYLRIGSNLRVSAGLPPELAYNVIYIDTDARASIGRIEENAFWLWAVVETLRHTGLRIEELLELTHLALVSHRLSTTGELVPLLQIVPSKTNEERLLLVTPDLARVLAEIISRLRNRHSGIVPLVARYDNYEATTGPRLPHLFQRDYGTGPTVMTAMTIRGSLRELALRMGLTDAAGNSIYLTPHDFRRVFTTTAVQDGLPLHIASRILGHKHLNSTQPYTAVFQDDLVRTYRAFVDRRRLVRPTEEYRDPTSEEWDEFEEHFTLRRVELGSCARPYGSSCEHEHACIRCPVLRVDPTQLDRIEAIAASLKERIAEADEHGWAGEVEQLKISLQAARDKILATAPPRDSSVLLDTPTMPPPNRRSV
ncbi:tyrosine-type recombinase/integrase [Mycobacteroides franklinii]|uniref:tyrosine-type recombinase/integrase n=1 Tax=Mycobacteroides franklinii TaxID=948102 RepID=UPI00195F1FDE|nr:site-specific integrase [Mycobacteroides franklinii]